MERRSRFVEKLKAGAQPTPEDWREFLLEFHNTPGLTPEAFKNFKTIHGKSSYQVLADTLPESVKSVLDLACGDGFLSQFVLPRLNAQGRLVGVDMSEGELESARANYKDSRISFVKADADSLPFPNAAFDNVLCHMAFMLMQPQEPVAREIARVLKPGGEFSAVVTGPADDDFLFAVRKLSLNFVRTRFPAVESAFAGDPRSTTVEGLRELFSKELGFRPIEKIHDLHLEIDTNPEGVWALMRNMYYISVLQPEDKEELRSQILEFSRKNSKFGRHLHFEFPMRIFSLRSER